MAVNVSSLSPGETVVTFVREIPIPATRGSKRPQPQNMAQHTFAYLPGDVVKATQALDELAAQGHTFVAWWVAPDVDYPSECVAIMRKG